MFIYCYRKVSLYNISVFHSLLYRKFIWRFLLDYCLEGIFLNYFSLKVGLAAKDENTDMFSEKKGYRRTTDTFSFT